jgi:hypothetical protein
VAGATAVAVVVAAAAADGAVTRLSDLQP